MRSGAPRVNSGIRWAPLSTRVGRGKGWRPQAGRVEVNAMQTHEIRPHRPARLPALPRHHDLRPAVRRGGRATPSWTRPPRAASTSSTAADVYPLGGGRSDRRAHRGDRRGWLKGKRQSFIVATKCVGQMGPKPWDQGMSRKHILDAIEASLKRLQTDYVDVYQLHSFDPDTPIDEALEALDAVVRSGKARYVGVSNWMAHRGRPRARPLGAEGPRPHRTPSSRATTCCSAPSSATSCRSARRRGWRSSPTIRSPAACSPASTTAAAPPPEGSRFQLGTAGARYQERYWHEREFDTVDALQAGSPTRPA